MSNSPKENEMGLTGKSSESNYTTEQLQKKSLLERVAKLYGVDAEAGKARVKNITDNLEALKTEMTEKGYRFGKAPHHMTQELRDEIRQMGQSFSEGSTLESWQYDSLSVGLYVLRTVVVKPNSQEFTEWSNFLEKRTGNQFLTQGN